MSGETATQIPDTLGFSIRDVEASYDPNTIEGRRRILDAAHDSGTRSGPPGFTEYEIRPQWSQERGPEGCTTTAVRVDVTVTITLPEGVSGGIERWLRRHEDGHRQIIETHARKLLSDLIAVRASTCPRLRPDIDRILHRAERALDQAHALYDGRG